MNSDSHTSSESIVRAKEQLLQKEPPPNTVVLLVGGKNSSSFQGTLGGMKIRGTLGEGGIVSNTQVEVKTGQLESNAMEAELHKRMDTMLQHSPPNARW